MSQSHAQEDDNDAIEQNGYIAEISLDATDPEADLSELNPDGTEPEPDASELDPDVAPDEHKAVDVERNDHHESEDKYDQSKRKTSPVRDKRRKLKRKQKLDIGKRKHVKQKYRKQWEETPEFKPWLTANIHDCYRATCRICQKPILAELTVISRHAKSFKHIKMMNSYKERKIIPVPKIHKRVADPTVTPFTTRTNEAELKLSAYVAAHNIPFAVVDHLVGVLRSSFPDSPIAQALKLDATKSTAIVRDVIGASHKEVLADKLKRVKFSILADELTDIGSAKVTCVVVRFYDEEFGQIVSRFWQLVEIFRPSDDETAEEGVTVKHIHDTLLNTFNEHGIPKTNIIGFASDGSNTMMAEQDSVATYFQESCPKMVIMKCLCHSLDVCASDACHSLPRRCEELARSIYSFMKNTTNQQAQFVEFQAFLNSDVDKLLHPPQTRWLSLLPVIEPIVEQWDALKHYFSFIWLGETLVSAEKIYGSLTDPFIKAFYLFLAWILPKFAAMNELYQSADVIITEFNDKMVVAYKEMLLVYMQQEYILMTPLDEIQPNEESKYLSFHQLFLGAEVMTTLDNPLVLARPELVSGFKRKCRDFLVRACLGIKARYNFADPIFSLMPLLNPKKAMSKIEREKWPSIAMLAKRLPRLCKEPNKFYAELDDDWKRMPNEVLPQEIVYTTEVDRFWHMVGTLKSKVGDPVFPTLPGFALATLSLPHSDANCERIFHKVHSIKTLTDNKLVTQTLTGVLLASQCVKLNDCCAKFQPSDDMLYRMATTDFNNGEGETMEMEFVNGTHIADDVDTCIANIFRFENA